MKSLNLGLLIHLLLISGCSSPQKKDEVCGEGRTMLDNVCVSQVIADYASCVRARGVELNEENNSNLGLNASYFGFGVDGAQNYSDRLKKKYSSSESVVLEVINRCDQIFDLNKTTHLNTTYNSNKTIKVVSIKGYGIDYSDNSHVCFYEEGPNYVMSDDPARCHTNWMESNATWESEVSIRKNELVMTMNNLRSAHPPLHTLGIGYIVEIEGGTFEDGSTKKKFILHKFTGTPIQSDITKRVKILL
jgi:hypothetical protein